MSEENTIYLIWSLLGSLIVINLYEWIRDQLKRK